MGDLYVAPPPHRCAPPIDQNKPRNPFGSPIAARPHRSVWQCDECGRIWEALEGLFSGPVWCVASAETMKRYQAPKEETT